MWSIIGYGNSLRSDDCFGLEVCKMLKAYSTIENLAKIIIVHQLMPELIDSINRSEGVIFVDTSYDFIPGDLQFILLNQIPKNNSLFSHYCTPQDLLDEVKRLYGNMPPAWLCTIGGVYFELGEELSPLLKEAVPKATKLILEKICSQEVCLDETLANLRTTS